MFQLLHAFTYNIKLFQQHFGRENEWEARDHKVGSSNTTHTTTTTFTMTTATATTTTTTAFILLLLVLLLLLLLLCGRADEAQVSQSQGFESSSPRFQKNVSLTFSLHTYTSLIGWLITPVAVYTYTVLSGSVAAWEVSAHKDHVPRL